MSAEPEATPADLELLEVYLDGELGGPETAAVAQRLSTDPLLASTLADLRAQRALRAAVWTALEPDTRAADQLVWRVRGAAAEHRHQSTAATSAVRSPARLRQNTLAVARWVAAAAACVVIGFSIGRIGRGAHDIAVSPTAAGTSTPNDPGAAASPLPGAFTSYSYPFQLPPEQHRYNDDFASHGPPLPAPASGLNDDRVKLSSDERVEQKF
jgi:anti-sigma factor RsiW